MSLSAYYLQLNGMELRHITAGRIFIGYYGYSMRQRRRELKGKTSRKPNIMISRLEMRQ